jgi:cation:H+ antiporter
MPMVVGSALLLWLFAWTGKRVSRSEGAVLLAGYGLFIAGLVWLPLGVR